MYNFLTLNLALHKEITEPSRAIEFTIYTKTKNLSHRTVSKSA